MEWRKRPLGWEYWLEGYDDAGEWHELEVWTYYVTLAHDAKGAAEQVADHLHGELERPDWIDGLWVRKVGDEGDGLRFDVEVRSEPVFSARLAPKKTGEHAS